MVKIGNTELGDFPLILAPMEEITNPPFRLLCKLHGADLVYSEFLSSEAIIRNIPKTLKKARILDEERPVTIQVYGFNEDSMKMAVEKVSAFNPDIIDINFGCPVKKVVAKGAGAAALKDVAKMIRLTETVVKSTHIPVTVKTRLGWDEQSICIHEIAEPLQDVGIHALAIHARTAKQKYSGKADWSWIGKTLENPRLKIPVFGNGDIDGPLIADLMKNTYPVAGLMIGRAAVGNPWIFEQIRNYLDNKELLPEPSLEERMKICLEHLAMSMEWKDERSAILEHRKYYKNYFKALPEFKLFRLRLMEVRDLETLEKVFSDITAFFKTLKLEP